MTSTRPFAAAISANDLFKANYEKTLRWSVLAALLLGAIMVLLSPRYEPTPYTLRQATLEIIDIQEIAPIIEEPQVAPPPALAPILEAVDDDDPRAVDEFILPKWELPVVRADVRPSGDPDFVASSSNPVLVAQPKPRYPEVARLAQVEGTVVVKVLVGVDGQVEAVQVIRGVHPLLDRAAAEAARRCVFEPGQQREIKVPTWVAVPYNFRLR